MAHVSFGGFFSPDPYPLMYMYPLTDDQVRRAMDYFTQSGKPLWGFSESFLDMTGLNLMGGCTKVINRNVVAIVDWWYCFG